MHAIILAGGFGTRLQHFTHERPKALVEIGGKPILEHQVDFLHAHGIDHIRLALHYKADKIITFCEEKWPGQIQFFVEPEPRGTGGAIKFASRDLREPFLVLNGDVLTDVDLESFLKRGANTIVCSFVDDARDFGLLDIEDNKVRAFREKPQEEVSGYVNGGLYFLHPDIFSAYDQDVYMVEQEIFPALAARGELNAYIHDGFLLDVGTEERFLHAQRKFGVV